MRKRQTELAGVRASEREGEREIAKVGEGESGRESTISGGRGRGRGRKRRAEKRVTRQ